MKACVETVLVLKARCRAKSEKSTLEPSDKLNEVLKPKNSTRSVARGAETST
jgi:hypothetical protein